MLYQPPSQPITTTTRKRRQDITSLQVQKSTRAKLDKIGDIHTETYDDIILRLIQFYNKNIDKKPVQNQEEEKVPIHLSREAIRLLRKIQKNHAADAWLLREAEKMENSQYKPMLLLTK